MEKLAERKKNIEYEIYISERNLLVEAEKSTAQQFDKAILTLAAGALALSLTFIKDLSPHPKGWVFCLLLFVWIVFILSMLSTLISFITSQKACRKQIEIIKNEFINSLEKSEEKNKLASATNILNYFSIIFFILGVIFLTIFCALNISIKEESKMSQKDKIDGGYVPPTKPIKPDEHGYAPPKPPQKPPEPPAKPVKK